MTHSRKRDQLAAGDVTRDDFAPKLQVSWEPREPPRLRMETVRLLRFGINGDADVGTDAGWSWPEPDFVWMLDEESELTLPVVAADGALVMVIRVAPFVFGEHRQQRLRVWANEHEIGDHTVTERRHLSYAIPASVLAGCDEIKLRFDHPDHVQPSTLMGIADTRSLSLAVTSLRLVRVRPMGLPGAPLMSGAGEQPSDRDLMLAFESLGHNCEFGLVQRRAGAEPLSLLRFAATPFAGLMDMLGARFEGMADPSQIRIEPVRLLSGDEEYLLWHSRYGTTYHTLSLASQIDIDRCRKRETLRLRVAERRLLEHLEAGDRICVFKQLPPLPGQDVFALHLALRDYGPNTLLHVVEADESHPPGTVEVLLDGLLRGFVSKFAPIPDAANADDQSWLDMCRQAHALWTGRSPAA